MVIVFDAQVAVTPAGKPVAAAMPVAPVVVCVIAVNAVPIHTLGEDEAAPAMFAPVTVIDAVLAVPFPHEFEGVTVSVPLVVAFNVLEFPVPVKVPVPLYVHV